MPKATNITGPKLHDHYSVTETGEADRHRTFGEIDYR